MISLIKKTGIYNRIIQLYAIKYWIEFACKRIQHKNILCWWSWYFCIRTFKCWAFKQPTLNFGGYLCIKVHYTNLSDLIMRAIIRAITVFTGLVVVVLRKCQHCPIVVLAFMCIRFVECFQKNTWDQKMEHQ